MKKYLMMSVAAIALASAFTSCSKETELYDPTASVSDKVMEYEKAFVQQFGQISPTQNWGFVSNSTTRGLSDYVGYKGTMTPAFNFPSDADASKFLAAVPDGVKSFTEVAGQYQTGYASGISYLDPSWTQMINIWGFWDGSKTVGGTLYVTGVNDFSNRQFTVAQNTDVYLVAGAKLILNNDASSTVKFNIYIAEGATLETAGKLKLDNGAQVYNHGTITANSFEVNNTSIMYNSGVLDVEGDIYAMNENSVIVNDGTLTGANLGTQGSGRFMNNAETTIEGETIVNSNDNTWVNNGRYETNNFTYTATSSDVINNCHLIVNNNFCMNISDGSGIFKVDGGGSVETKYFYGGGDFTAKDNNGSNVTYQGGPFRIDLGSKSLFKVSETATLNALASGIVANGYGFHGVGGDYAVFQAKKIVKTRDGEGNVVYGGKLYVSADTHFAQGYSGAYPFIHYQNGCSEANIYAAGFNSGTPSVTIPETPCNPGFKGGDDPIPPVDGGMIICEDMGSIGDFDFNDVVFTAVRKENNKWEITLLAAGGLLPIEVAGVQVNDVMGKMVNTGYKNVEPYTFTTTNSYDNLIDIPVVVRMEDAAGNVTSYALTAEIGKAPQKICVPLNYKWCDEYISIQKAYEGFKSWVSGGSDTWSNSYVDIFVDLDLSNNPEGSSWTGREE